MKRKSLLILTPGFPKDENDGNCLPTQQLFVSTLKRKFSDINIVIVSLHYPYHKKSYTWNGVEVFALNGRAYKKILRPILWFNALQTLTQCAQKLNVVGVISFWCNETALIGSFFAKRHKLTHKIWISGQDARQQNKFVKWIKPLPGDLVAMSDFLKDEFKRNHLVEAEHVIYNGIVPRTVAAPKNIHVIGVGSLIPLKCFHVFIEVVKSLKQNIPDIETIIVGTGPQEEFIKAKISGESLDRQIQMAGEVDHSKVQNLFSQAKVLVHPSSYEGYSTVCLEALAAGCHVVSFTRAEHREIAHWHIVSDTNAMIERVKWILQNETDFAPVVARNIEHSADEMMRLFTQ